MTVEEPLTSGREHIGARHQHGEWAQRVLDLHGAGVMREDVRQPTIGLRRKERTPGDSSRGSPRLVLRGLVAQLRHLPKSETENGTDVTPPVTGMESGDMTPINGIVGCCARTAMGHPAAPPRRVMNSRRLL
jgi:hypothetical protein